MDLKSMIVGVLIGLCCFPALREIWKRRSLDGWDRMARKRVKDLRAFHDWRERERERERG